MSSIQVVALSSTDALYCVVCVCRLQQLNAGEVVDVCRDVAAWPGRHLLEGGEQRRYFGLRTAEQRVIEFECGSQREYELWTKGVARLLAIVDGRKR